MGNRFGLLVEAFGLVFEGLELLFLREFADVAIEICGHFLEKYDGFCSFDVIFFLQDLILNEFDDVVANLH